MYLKSIRLENFKCLEQITLDFDAEQGESVRKTTFLVGKNGSGKTTLLQAIALLTGGSEALLRIPGLPERFLANKKKYCVLEAEFLTSEGATRRLSLRLERGQSTAAFRKQARQGLEEIDQARSKAPGDFLMAAYGSDRQVADQPLMKAHNPAPGSLLDDKASLAHPRRVADFLGQHGHKNSFLKWREALQLLLPTEIRCAAWTGKGDDLLFKTNGSTQDFASLSRGWQQCIAWVSDFVYQSACQSGNFNNPLASRGLLLLDGLDLQTHPTAQRLLHQALALAFPHTQVIATCYAPLTVQQAGPGELYALHRHHSGATELVPFVGNPSSLLLHQLLMSPVFDLPTDESLQTEQAKDAARATALHTAKPPGRARAGGAQKLGAAMPERSADALPPRTRSNSNTDPEDLALLRQIQAALLGATAQKPSNEEA